MPEHKVTPYMRIGEYEQGLLSVVNDKLAVFQMISAAIVEHGQSKEERNSKSLFAANTERLPISLVQAELVAKEKWRIEEKIRLLSEQGSIIPLEYLFTALSVQGFVKHCFY